MDKLNATKRIKAAHRKHVAGGGRMSLKGFAREHRGDPKAEVGSVSWAASIWIGRKRLTGLRQAVA